MKLNAIKAACLRMSNFTIYNEPGGQQWIGNNVAFWPVDGIVLTEESIPAVFDLTPKKLEKIIVRTWNPQDDSEKRVTREKMPDVEILCEASMVQIKYHSITYIPIYTEQGVMFLDAGHLKPAENSDGYLEFYVRRNEYGHVLIACYGNLFVSAVVVPVPESVAEEILDAVNLFGNMPVMPTSGWGGDPLADEQLALPEPQEMAGQIMIPPDDEEE